MDGSLTLGPRGSVRARHAERWPREPGVWPHAVCESPLGDLGATRWTGSLPEPQPYLGAVSLNQPCRPLGLTVA